MKRLRPLLLSFALALAVLLGQQATAVHALAHAAGEMGQHDSLPAPSKCGDHSLYSSLAAAASGKAPVAPFVAAAAAGARAEAVRSAALPPRYRLPSRAPPATPA